MLEKGTQWKVLDHGYIKLIDWMGDDADIVRAARMSTNRGFEGWEPGEVCKNCRARFVSADLGTVNHLPDCPSGQIGGITEWVKVPGDTALLETLLSERHTTPFEMVELKLEVMAPLMVYREWHRHRTQSYNEWSARYAQMANLHYIPSLERICKQSTINKQGSGEPFDPEEAKNIRDKFGDEQDDIYEFYDALIKDGVAKEIARINTPVSRYSKMTVKTDLWNWFAFLNLREDPPAQWEIREYAKVIGHTIIKDLFPKSYELWLEHMRYAIRLSRTEHKVLREFFHALDAEVDDGLLLGLREMARKALPGKKAERFMKKIITEKE
jgi:thymidylate synthase (FAD)